MTYFGVTVSAEKVNISFVRFDPKYTFAGKLKDFP
jgi:hypothetical protein